MNGHFPPDPSRGKSCHFSVRKRLAFSLIEVVISLGIISYAILALLALYPLSAARVQDTLEETRAVGVLSAVIADRQATLFTSPSQVYKLPALTPGMEKVSGTIYIGSEGNINQLSSLSEGPLYRLDYTVIPPTLNGLPSSLEPYRISFKIGWPGASSNPVGSVETVATYPQP